MGKDNTDQWIYVEIQINSKKKKKMIESGYYPPGAEFDPRAPWNEQEVPERRFDVCISQTLSKSTRVTTNDYIPEVDQDEGGVYKLTDTSDTDWKKAYNNEHYTPLGLIQEFKEMLEKNTPIPETRRKHLIDECMNWIEDDLEVCEG